MKTPLIMAYEEEEIKIMEKHSKSRWSNNNIYPFNEQKEECQQNHRVQEMKFSQNSKWKNMKNNKNKKNILKSNINNKWDREERSPWRF